MDAKRNVHVMYIGRFGGLARVHYEVNLNVSDPNKIAMALVRLIRGLTSSAMKALVDKIAMI